MTTRNKFIILWILGLILGFCACSSDNGIEDTPGTGQEEPGGSEGDKPSEGDGEGQDSVEVQKKYSIRYAADYEKYLADAERWPGLVGDSLVEKRLEGVKVTIDARYTRMHANSRLSIGSTPWFSTGLYAAPGEIITVVRPHQLTSTGVKVSVRINASNCDLKNYSGTKNRADKIWIQEQMNGDTLELVNYYGGNIYIVPAEPLDKKWTFTITGAVKSPDFVLGTTNESEWLEAIRKSTVPMAELEGKRIIWTFPTKYLKTLTNPAELMEFYDDAVVNTFNRFNGLTDDASDLLHRSPSFKHRGCADINTCAGAAHSGYPCMYGESMNYASRFIQLNLMKNEGGAWGFFHELGHNYQTWVWKWDAGPGSIGEVTNNLYIMYDRNRRKTWPQQTENYADVVNGFVLSDKPDKDFDEGNEGDLIPSGKGSRIVPFVQLAQKFGWKFFTYMVRCAREMDNVYANSLTKDWGRREFFCKRLCEFAQADMRPFLDAWGIKYGDVANAEMASMPPYEGDKFWERWDAGVIASVEQLSQSDLDRIKLKLPDDTYNNVLGEIKRTDWTITAEGSVWKWDKTVGGAPEKVLDNDMKSCIMWVKPGKTYSITASSSPDGEAHSLTGKEPMSMTIDMHSEETFNYAIIRHRTDMTGGFHVQKLKLLGSNDGKNFEEISEITVDTEPSVAHRLDLNKTYRYRYVKVQILEWMQANYTVCIADFRLGCD